MQSRDEAIRAARAWVTTTRPFGRRRWRTERNTERNPRPAGRLRFGDDEHDPPDAAWAVRQAEIRQSRRGEKNNPEADMKKS